MRRARWKECAGSWTARSPGTRACASSKTAEVYGGTQVAGEWGASISEVGREVQRRVGAYLQQMANVEPDAVDVIVDEIGPL